MVEGQTPLHASIEGPRVDMQIKASRFGENVVVPQDYWDPKIDPQNIIVFSMGTPPKKVLTISGEPHMVNERNPAPQSSLVWEVQYFRDPAP